MWAAFNGYIGIVDLLIREQANIHLESKVSQIIIIILLFDICSITKIRMEIQHYVLLNLVIIMKW
jgi:hypothetical protein